MCGPNAKRCSDRRWETSRSGSCELHLPYFEVRCKGARQCERKRRTPCRPLWRPKRLKWRMMTRRSKKAELRLLSPRSGVSRETARAAFAIHGFRFFKASLQSLVNLRLRVPVPRARRAFLHRRLAAVHEVTSRVAMLQLGSLRLNMIPVRLCGARRQVVTKMPTDKLDRKQKLQDRH